MHPQPTRKTLTILTVVCYLLIVSVFLSLAIPAVREARRDNPTVYVTRAGDRYHQGYHYSDRTRALNLYDAIDKGYTHCRTCHPYDERKFIMPPWYYRRWLAILLIFTAVSYFVGGWLIGWATTKDSANYVRALIDAGKSQEDRRES